jgi:succinoglycan biosynthesis protein ExoL
VKVLALMPVAQHPRFQKRLRQLKAAKFDVTAAAFARDYFPGSPGPVEVESLGEMSHGSYFGRARSYSAVRRLIRARGPFDVIYAFGTDLGLLSRLSAWKSRVIVEIGDIREVLVSNGIPARVVQVLDSAVVRSADGVVVTSTRFVEDYYQGLRGITPQRVLLLENKIDHATWTAMEVEIQKVRSSRSPAVPGGLLTIGYFGVLRCPFTWQVLSSWAAADPEHRRVLVRGHLGEGAPSREEMAGAAGVTYGGPYRWPEELPDLYGQVDMVCAAAPVRTDHLDNKAWARANRFYESCCFQKPLLVSRGGGDEPDVIGFGIGTGVPFDQPREALEVISAINSEDLARWREGLRRVPRSVYVETEDEWQELSSLITGRATVK